MYTTRSYHNKPNNASFIQARKIKEEIRVIHVEEITEEFMAAMDNIDIKLTECYDDRRAWFMAAKELPQMEALKLIGEGNESCNIIRRKMRSLLN